MVNELYIKKPFFLKGNVKEAVSKRNTHWLPQIEVNGRRT